MATTRTDNGPPSGAENDVPTSESDLPARPRQGTGRALQRVRPPHLRATEVGAQKGLNLNILAAKDHAEAFLMVETGRAAAFVMDDILLYSLVAGSKSPPDYVISVDALSVEPYGTW
jgi:ABC-type amino acid transport substrate-binding protein